MHIPVFRLVLGCLWAVLEKEQQILFPTFNNYRELCEVTDVNAV